MALLNHDCEGAPHESGHADFVIHGRVVVRRVPITSCSACGYWGTRHEDSVKLGHLAAQLGRRRVILRLEEVEKLTADLTVDFASLPFAKTEH